MTSMSNDTSSETIPQATDEGRNPAGDAESRNEAGSRALKANILHRTIARVIDILIALAFFRVIPSVGFWFGLVYLFIADGFWNGQSVGKKLLGLRVVKYGTRGTVSFKESIVRNFPIIIGFFLFPIPFIGWLFLTVVLILEFLMILGSDHGRRIGDELANTLVIDVPSDDQAAGKNIKEHTTDGV